MSDPVTATIAGFQMIGSIMGGSANSSNYNAQANAMQQNAVIEQQRAQQSLESANSNEEDQRRKSRMILGSQRAALAQAGVGLDGSAADIYQQSATNAELDAQNIRYQGALAANSYTNQAALDQLNAQQLKKNAKAAMTAGYIGAGSAALSGFSKGFNSTQPAAPVFTANPVPVIR